jgi:hypothetical protein
MFMKDVLIAHPILAAGGAADVCRPAISFAALGFECACWWRVVAVLALLTQLDVGGLEAEAAALPNQARRVPE